MTTPVNLIGQTFERLFVVKEAPHIKRRRAYLCKCFCGKEVVVRVESLRSGQTKSCGCLKIEKIAALNASHNMCNSPEYKSWCHAKSRCNNEKDPKYKDYGLRGIKMCSEWENSFDSFFEHVGKKPSKNHSIGRIDVEKNYEPGNVRWETFHEQARARTDNVLVDVDGKTYILKDACNLLGINYKRASALLKKGVSWESLKNEQ